MLEIGIRPEDAGVGYMGPDDTAMELGLLVTRHGRYFWFTFQFSWDSFATQKQYESAWIYDIREREEDDIGPEERRYVRAVQEILKMSTEHLPNKP